LRLANCHNVFLGIQFVNYVRGDWNSFFQDIQDQFTHSVDLVFVGAFQ